MAQQVFLDSEFTDFKNPKLISIGIVAQSGEEFYAEVEFLIDECNDFVRMTVIPLLNQVKAYSLLELKDAMSSWIEMIREDGPLLICCDSEYDHRMLRQIFEGGTPKGVVLRILGASYLNKAERIDWHVLHNQPEHHALHDARALKHSFRGWLRDPR